MSSPLDALVRAYELRRTWTLGMDRLGLPDARRHSFDPKSLPTPDLQEINGRTKFPAVLCVETSPRQLLPLKSPLSPEAGVEITRDLVRRGVHPLDVIIATLRDDEWVFRSAVDHLYWTWQDQRDLERRQQGAT